MSRVNPAPSDGRAFTSYMSAGQTNALMQSKYGVKPHDNLAYRTFLQVNADAVQRDSRRLQTFDRK